MATLYIFRRDFRTDDNNGLRHAISLGKPVYPIFIATPEQLKKNKYFSQPAVDFMFSALYNLNGKLKKYKSGIKIIRGKNMRVIERVCSQTGITDIVFNMDYTPYARKRDDDIMRWCEANDIKCHAIEDYLLAPIGKFCKSDGNPYKVFSPFKNNLLKNKKYISKPTKFAIKNMTKFKGNSSFPNNNNLATRKYAIKLMNRSFSNYENQRNFPAIVDATSGLSPYIKFGLVSIREVFWTWYRYKAILSQLIWREFYYYLTYYNPGVLEGENFNGKKIKWKHNTINFRKWKDGKTGVPIVDAGMRELNTTGKMHNRLRLITANFLTRKLKEDWKLGEQYFATKLVDYDPAVNNGNWQWVAGTGTNTKPEKQQIFNPWLQSRKYDSNCEYIKKWVPELKNVEPRNIHNKDGIRPKNYIKPIIKNE